jgi:hypothetical protein
MGGGGSAGKENNVRLPHNDSQLNHIMRNKKGHLRDTPENRWKLLQVARDERNFKGIDRNGNRDYRVLIDKNNELWVKVRNGIIQNGGLNSPPLGD